MCSQTPHFSRLGKTETWKRKARKIKDRDQEQTTILRQVPRGRHLQLFGKWLLGGLRTIGSNDDPDSINEKDIETFPMIGEWMEVAGNTSFDNARHKWPTLAYVIG